VNCAQTRNLLHAFLDGELDLVRHLEIEHHLAECTGCAEEHEGLRSLSAALKADALYFRAPPELSKHLRASLPRTSAITSAPVRAPEPLPSRRSIPWRRLGVFTGVAASIALLVGGLVLLSLGRFRSGVPAEDRLAQEVVTSHIRSLLADHLTDVTSSDRHTVKPWFKGRVDFAPTVCDLSDRDFPLVGGRLDYLDDRVVAALVYRRRQHLINLFVWPATQAPERGPRPATRNGYHVVHWVAGGMNWWAVSDLGQEELQEFVGMVRKEATPAGP